jgi:hemoglobin
MPRFFGTVVTMAITAMLLGPAAGQQASLYERLGGYDAIAASMDELLSRMEEQKFSSASDDSRMRTRQLIVDFVCKETGGPCFYAGRDLKTAHVGLGITEDDWDEFVATFVAVMNDFDVPEQEQNDLAELLLPAKEHVVE